MKFTLFLRDEHGVMHEVLDNVQEYRRDGSFNRMEVYAAIHDKMEEVNKHYTPAPMADLPPRHMQDLPPKKKEKKRRPEAEA